MKENTLTKILQKVGRAIDIILLTHPVRTSLGILLGIGVSIIAKMFAPFLNQLSFVNLDAISIWEYLIIGVLVLHIPTIRYLLAAKSIFLDENLETAFNIIKEAKRENLPDWQINQMYLKVCEKVLQNVELKSATREELREFK